MNAFKRITVSPIATAVGAEIGGVDLATDLDAATVAEIRQALLQHLVIFFRDQDLTDIEQHKAFTRHFAELFVHPNFDMGQDNPEIVYLIREPGDTKVAGGRWHADTTMMAEPPMGAILYALEAPECGGDTLFANQYLAYETLSDGMKALLAKLKAVHNDRRVAGPGAGLNAQRATKVREDADWRMTEHSHPVVRTHPETGRKSLFVNCIYVERFEGMTVEESAPLLHYLYDHCSRPEFTCRFRWQTHSVAFWDNRCVQHLAIHDNRQARRSMQRTQLRGEPVQ